MQCKPAYVLPTTKKWFAQNISVGNSTKSSIFDSTRVAGVSFRGDRFRDLDYVGAYL